MENILDLNKLRFPQKSIYNDIDKWYNGTEMRDSKYGFNRIRLFGRFDRYFVENLTDFFSEEDIKGFGKNRVSLISLLPWFDENKYIEYAEMLVDKKTYSSQFEHIFNAIIMHYLIDRKFDIALKFMHHVFDRAIEEPYKYRTFDIFIPEVGVGLSHCRENVYKTMIVMKYLSDHPDVKMKSYIKTSAINNLVRTRDIDDLDDLEKDDYKMINTILKKYAKNTARFESYGISQNGILIRSSPEMMIQAFESNATIFAKYMDSLDDFWNDNLVKYVKECYEKYPERFNAVLIAFFSSGSKKSVLTRKARILKAIDTAAPYMNIAENVIPYTSEAFQAEYLLSTI